MDRSAWTVTEVSESVVVPLIRGGHYLHKMPAIVTCCLLLTVDQWSVGAVVWAIPPRETIRRYQHSTWELARLWLTDELPRNSETWLIGRSIRHVRSQHPAVKHLVSYADPKQGHVGIIYRASNWTFDGMTDSERKTPRFDYFFGNRRLGRRAHAVGRTVVKVRRSSKYRYSFCLAPAEHG